MIKLTKILVSFSLILTFFSISSVYASLNNSSILIKPLPTPIINFIDTYNFHKVDNNYYRGGQPDKDDYSNFAILGIKTIINLRNANENDNNKQKTISEKFGINYINIPMKSSQPPTNEQIAYFFKILDNPENLPVYVHCWQGKDRTGIMTALYRVKDYNWNFDQAYSEMKQRGYHSLFFPKQREFLHNFTRNLVSSKIY